MACGDSPATFESWLNQATDPNNQEDRWDCIQGFYQLVNKQADGPQIAVRLLAHKIQSPQEKEGLQAITVLEACMNNCGKRFHKEAAKFRFLNELIKILLPKYFGAWTPQKVKDRVVEVLYGWTLWLKEEPKIQEAYFMLKKQGIVKKDPKLPDTLIMAPPPQRTTDSVFDQEDKATLLARLLKSQRPEDLETANRLIKSTIQEEQDKAEKTLKRESTLKEVESSTKRLRELLEQRKMTEASLQPSDDLQSLFERCDRLRPSLFRLASDTVEDDAALSQILAANDELTLVVNAYKHQVGRRDSTRDRSKSEEETAVPTSPREIKSYHLIDLSALDSPETRRKTDNSPLFFKSSSPVLSSCDENSFHSVADQFEINNLASKQTEETKKSYYEELMQLDGDIQVESSRQNRGRGPMLRSRGCGGNSLTSNGIDAWSGSLSVVQKPLDDMSGQSLCPPHLLQNIFVPLETVKPSHLQPITLHDHGGVRVSLHFAKDSPPGHPGVAVFVISTVNTSALDVKALVFQAAAPKTMLLKVQPSSGTHLPPYNPLLPPPAISQVLLLANPEKHKVRLRYKLTLTHGHQQLNETRDIDNFPDWTSLIGH
ncbi:ADP-ribosylation factor-binding protein GGA3 [Betta splendens]|uniref:ADP-ribosylation factor-binding protein GGA3 n=1 Tax=Betta splendens TaxID=158456 RepID=A0A6P7MBV4_BETSP|nr:ADP-ribosylation factor-binding protein GGA3 [Betta splendens]